MLKSLLLWGYLKRTSGYTQHHMWFLSAPIGFAAKIAAFGGARDMDKLTPDLQSWLDNSEEEVFFLSPQ